MKKNKKKKQEGDKNLFTALYTVYIYIYYVCMYVCILRFDSEHVLFVL